VRELYQIDFSDDQERSIFLQEMAHLRGLHNVEIRPSKLRTSAQNRLYWGVYIATWRRHLADQGDLFSPQRLHKFLARKFLMEPTFLESTGEIIGEEERSTTELSPKEFGEYLTQIEKYLAESFGLHLPRIGDRT
jgi:hypothetical protein